MLKVVERFEPALHTVEPYYRGTIIDQLVLGFLSQAGMALPLWQWF
jgi:hypothetical protein